MSDEGSKAGKYAGRFNIPNQPTWVDWESLSFLRAIGLLKIGYAGTIIIPIYAHAVDVWNTWAAANGISFVLPLSWSLALTYIGSVLLALGQLLNEIFCPRLVKVHQNLKGYQEYLGEFVANETAITQAAEYARRLAVSLHADKAFSNINADARDKLVDLLVKKISGVNSSPEPTEPTVDQYRNIWQEANRAMPAVRWVIAICYLAAAGITVVLTSMQAVKIFTLVGALLSAHAA